jgi:hypothetical protein
MTPNPYQPPQQPMRAAAPGVDVGAAPAGNRTLFVLAAVGAGLASLYWATLTLLIGLGVAIGSGSPVQIILPFVLIVLYAVRGYQLFQGDPLAARRILWLHGIGGLAAFAQMASAGGFWGALQGVKIVIHVFGGVMAFLALRSVTASPRRPA